MPTPAIYLHNILRKVVCSGAEGHLCNSPVKGEHKYFVVYIPCTFPVSQSSSLIVGLQTRIQKAAQEVIPPPPASLSSVAKA
jgi:hypothetical protein